MNKMFLSFKNFIQENKLSLKKIQSFSARTVFVYFLFSHLPSQQSGFTSWVINLGFVVWVDK